MSNATKWLAASATVLAAISASSAQAQEESADEIIVTATRDSSRLIDVPMSVNVATGAQLEALSILDVKEISQLAPGLSLTNNTGRRMPKCFIIKFKIMVRFYIQNILGWISKNPTVLAWFQRNNLS